MLPEVLNLHDAVAWLDDLGYDTYLLGRRNAMRINGNCWNGRFETWSWSDLLSIRRELLFNDRFQRKYNEDFY